MLTEMIINCYRCLLQ